MKKNIAMRIAAFLFILTMISTCAFATTFAKYTTTGSASDTARVAKWGVVITASDADNNEYEYETSTVDAQIKTSATEKTLAPGSTVNFVTFTLTGTPEVSVSVDYEATLTLTGWKVGETEYCPLVFNVAGVSYSWRQDVEHKDETVAQFAARVVAAINAYDQTYQVSETLNLSNATQLSVSCSWDYSTSAENDIKDTALGDLATTVNAPTISLTVSCTATQVD